MISSVRWLTLTLPLHSLHLHYTLVLHSEQFLNHPVCFLSQTRLSILKILDGRFLNLNYSHFKLPNFHPIRIPNQLDWGYFNQIYLSSIVLKEDFHQTVKCIFFILVSMSSYLYSSKVFKTTPIYISLLHFQNLFIFSTLERLLFSETPVLSYWFLEHSYSSIFLWEYLACSIKIHLFRF